MPNPCPLVLAGIKTLRPIHHSNWSKDYNSSFFPCQTCVNVYVGLSTCGAQVFSLRQSVYGFIRVPPRFLFKPSHGIYILPWNSLILFAKQERPKAVARSNRIPWYGWRLRAMLVLMLVCIFNLCVKYHAPRKGSNDSLVYNTTQRALKWMTETRVMTRPNIKRSAGD